MKPRAGPHADDKDVTIAAGQLKGVETRRKRKKGFSAREKDVEAKLVEGGDEAEKGVEDVGW